MLKDVIQKIPLNCNVLIEAGKLYTFLNPYSYIQLRKNQELLKFFDCLYVDGISLVLLLKIIGEKVNRASFDMTSLAPIIFKQAVKENKSIYFIGAKESEIQQAILNIKLDFPELDICGYRHGYFNSETERNFIINKVSNINPDLVIAGMGAPLQEQILIDLQNNGWAGCGFTCGGFLHQTAKKGTQYYPDWMDRFNIRWAYRIYDEPALIFRYVKSYPLFFFIYLFDLIKR